MVKRGMCVKRGDAWLGVFMVEGGMPAIETATEGCSTHPTRMHSCFYLFFVIYIKL